MRQDGHGTAELVAPPPAACTGVPRRGHHLVQPLDLGLATAPPLTKQRLQGARRHRLAHVDERLLPVLQQEHPLRVQLLRRQPQLVRHGQRVLRTRVGGRGTQWCGQGAQRWLLPR